MKNYNPKSLKGQDKLNRIKDLMGRMSTLNESTSHSELELIKKGPNGIVYGIVRENHDYFIKTSNKNGGSLLAEDFNYIGGLQNKFDERYKSYSEALKQLNLKFDMLNESYGIEKNTNLFESDGVAFGGGTGFGFVMEEEDEEEVTEGEKEIISDDDDLEEQKKVLKVDTPKVEEPVEDEIDVDMSGDSAEIDMGMDDMEMDSEEDVDMDMEGGDEDTKKIQKYTGKIGQMLRDMDEADPELEKYVINSIISALHLDEMDEEDKEDIIAKIEGDEEEGEGVDLDLDSDLDLDAGEEGDETEEVDMDVELSEGKKKKEKNELEITPDMIAMLLKDGECECSGQKLVYKPKEKEKTNESRRRNKKSILESYLRNKTKRTLGKVLKESGHICERCMGKGCSSCLNEHHMGSKATHKKYPHYDREAYITMKEGKGMCNECGSEYIKEGMCMECGSMNEGMMTYKKSKLKRPKKADLNKDGKISSYERKRGRAIEKSMESRGLKKGRRMMDEDMDIFDSIMSDSIDMYPHKPRGRKDDFIEMDYSSIMDYDYQDSDDDGIPNKMDLDSGFHFPDKEIDNTVVLDQFDDDVDMNAPTKDPKTKPPKTKPGKRPKRGWEKIPRPRVNPKPKAMDKPKRSFRRRGMF
jgi:hypothetical protein